MTLPYADAIELTASKKIVFAKAVFKKHFYDWTLNEAGIWRQDSVEPVQWVSENDVEAIETASYAALQALSVTTVGGWFWDESVERLYYKAVTGTTAFENLIVAEIVFRWSQFPEEDLSGNPHDAKIKGVPPLSLAISQIFESKVGQTGSGSMGVETADQLFSRTDFEPDGIIELSERIE
jgi:hypothetical protein